jgi:hypothetical protein
MKKTAICLSLLATVVSPLFSSAHPGHGETDGYSITHYFTEPVHAIATVGMLVAAVALIYITQRKKQHHNK